ncbi:Ankyrin repeat and SAM domain-containing protein 1A, partial [Durusdinium trenchii]
RKYGARLLDVGTIEDGGDRGWAFTKAPQVGNRVPFVSSAQLHAMCYGPRELQKSPAAIARQARQTRVNAVAERRPPSRATTPSSSVPLLLEDARMERQVSQFERQVSQVSQFERQVSQMSRMSSRLSSRSILTCRTASVLIPPRAWWCRT